MQTFSLQTRYLNNNPLALVSIIRDCLKTELSLVTQHENVSSFQDYTVFKF